MGENNKLMNFVLFHKGDILPAHFSQCIRQILATNPQSVIYILTNLNISVVDDRIRIVDINKFDVPDIGDYYIHDTYSDLWRTSMMRLMYIEEFLNDSQITDIIHFDNDVLIYENINDIHEKLKQFNFIMTSHFRPQFVFGFSYIKSADSLYEVNKRLLDLVKIGEDKLIDLTGAMPHEMRLLGYINEQSRETLIDRLPVVPYGEGSDHFEIFNCIFDPSSYGKHLGGSHEHGPHNSNFKPTDKWTGTESHHSVGKALINKNIAVDFINHKPVVTDSTGQIHKLYNLHIHSKDLQKWS